LRRRRRRGKKKKKKKKKKKRDGRKCGRMPKFNVRCTHLELHKEERHLTAPSAAVIRSLTH